MRFINQGRGRFVAAAVAMLLAAGVGMSVAATSSTAPPSNAIHKGRGINEFGMTKGFLHGHTARFVYNKGFWCDRHIRSTASSKCEAGKKWKKAPSRQHDPLYIMVPLGFNVKPMKEMCPDQLVCVDHPGTIDLRRLEPALKPLYPDLTKKQLLKALSNFATPGHEHFVTTAFHGKSEWWDTYVVGVTSRQEYNKIKQHKSAHYLLKQVKKGKTTPVIPTNLFLRFAVK